MAPPTQRRTCGPTSASAIANPPVTQPGRHVNARNLLRRSKVCRLVRWCGDVAQVRVCEECADDVGEVLESLEGIGCLVLEVVLAGDAGFADAVVFDVLPDPFVGVEFRRVSGKTEEFESPVGGFDEF